MDQLFKASKSLVTSAAGSSKTILGKILFGALAFAFIIGMTGATASAQTPPGFDFSGWGFGYEPHEWIGVVIALMAVVIVAVVAFKLGVRFLMRVTGWTKSAMAAK